LDYRVAVIFYLIASDYFQLCVSRDFTSFGRCFAVRKLARQQVSEPKLQAFAGHKDFLGELHSQKTFIE